MDGEREMAAVCDTPQTRADQMIVAKPLHSDWRGGRLEKKDSDWETEEVNKVSSENRVSRESFLSTGDRYDPLHVSCSTMVKGSDSDDHHHEEEEEEEPVPSSLQVKDSTECSESEDSDWSEDEVSEMSSENRELWEFFLNNGDPYNLLHLSCSTKVKSLDNEEEEEEESICFGSQGRDKTGWSEKKKKSNWSNEGLSETNDLNGDVYNPLHFACSTKVKLKASEIQQNHTPLRPTASEGEELPGRSTKKTEKKVRFSEQVTIHTLQAWGAESRAARDGSCWMEMARDRERFRRRVNQAEEVISACLSAQHRAKVIASLLKHSDGSSLMTDWEKKLFPFILAAIFLQLFFCAAVVTSVH